MYYYEVLVGHQSYHGTEALTYSWESELPAGSVVRVSLRNRNVLGIVVKKVAKPGFTVKPMRGVSAYPPLPAQTLQLLDWLSGYYPAPLGAVVRLFLPPSEAFPKASQSVPAPTRPKIALPELTPQQASALETISTPGSYLLHGITGSGKSRVYVELAKRAVASSKSALILTPEIGLTAQLTGTFREVFGTNVYLLHSAQTAAERRDVWYQILAATGPIVVIGPRSALFAPIRNAGLIVLDEAHDSAYKNESAPHYQAGRVAGKLAMLHDAIYVTGSATPSIEDYYVASEKGRPIVAMDQLARSTEANLSFDIVDMKQSDVFGRSRIFSTALLEALARALKTGEQSLIFLNRRGTANVVLCNNCGWQTLCPNCDLTLTYHGDEHRLRCHVCGYAESLPSVCPVCGNAEIILKSIGTKAVVDEAKRLFPQAKIQRFDTDLKKSERIEQNLYSIQQGDIDILVGTQMLGKGLDLPKLSLVGIINADSSLLLPDYTAQERTYQLITQVVGRVGRGHRAGKVVMQTYNPENITLLAALHKDWTGFYRGELEERRLYHFPPFVYLLKLRVLRANSLSAQKAAETLKTDLLEAYPGLYIEGPAPSFHPRVGGKYSWQLLIKATQRHVLTDIITALPSGWSYDIDPINLL